MNDFVDARCWPLVSLRMPGQVPDERAHELITQLKSLWARAEPFVLLMGGVELPRQSTRFMAAYAQWSRESLSLQERYCLGAVRIEPDEDLRREYVRKGHAWEASGRAPYPYRVVATYDEAETQAHAWLDGSGLAAAGTEPSAARNRQ